MINAILEWLAILIVAALAVFVAGPLIYIIWYIFSEIWLSCITHATTGEWR